MDYWAQRANTYSPTLLRNGSNDNQQEGQILTSFRFRELISTTVKRGNGKLSRWQFAGAKQVFFSIVLGLAWDIYPLLIIRQAF